MPQYKLAYCPFQRVGSGVISIREKTTLNLRQTDFIKNDNEELYRQHGILDLHFMFSDEVKGFEEDAEQLKRDCLADGSTEDRFARLLYLLIYKNRLKPKNPI